MLRPLRWSDAAAERIRRRHEHAPLNDVRLSVASLQDPPAGYVSDAYGTELGQGPAIWATARAALDAFAMYPPHMATVHTGPGPMSAGSVFVAQIRGYGFYTLLPGRVLETFDEADDDRRRYGFTFATTKGHVEQGVERFEVHWNARTDQVRFDAAAISRPGPLLQLVAPLARHLQLEFHRLSPGAMVEAVSGQQGSVSPAELR